MSYFNPEVSLTDLQFHNLGRRFFQNNIIDMNEKRINNCFGATVFPVGILMQHIVLYLNQIAFLSNLWFMHEGT